MRYRNQKPNSLSFSSGAHFTEKSYVHILDSLNKIADSLEKLEAKTSTKTTNEEEEEEVHGKLGDVAKHLIFDEHDNDVYDNNPHELAATKRKVLLNELQQVMPQFLGTRLKNHAQL